MNKKERMKLIKEVLKDWELEDVDKSGRSLKAIAKLLIIDTLDLLEKKNLLK